jgi:hypothetical protein
MVTSGVEIFRRVEVIEQDLFSFILIELQMGFKITPRSNKAQQTNLQKERRSHYAQ